MTETDLKKKCNKILQDLPDSKWVSYSPYPFGVPGTPDKLGCISGRMVLIEFKLPGKSLSKQQALQIELWKEAGAIVFVIHSKEELIQALEEINALKSKGQILSF